MKIVSVRIKNIRGFQNRKIDLDMIPNKPSILVAPNGSGKSSFAIAFKSLKSGSLQVEKNEIYSDNDALVPELTVETDTSTFVANPNKNELSKDFDVYVINNQNKAKAITNNIAGTRVSKARMHIAPIVLIKNFPQPSVVQNSFIEDNHLQNLVQGAIPSINVLLQNNEFLAKIDTSKIKPSVKQLRLIDAFITKLKTYTGRKVDIWEKIENEDIPLFSSFDMVNSLASYCQSYNQNDRAAINFLKAIQIIKLYLKDKDSFKKSVTYAKYILERNSYRELFSGLNGTWKNIRPKEFGNNFIIEISDTSKISNGERDSIVFLALLQQAKKTFKKRNNILIIDEIFDYLDDANLIAAQYYITILIDEIKAKGCNIFPIILSHLNPNYFKSYAFSDLKVYYLNTHKPIYSDNMRILLNRRSTLMKEDKENDSISKYMLHFHNDYSKDMSTVFDEKAELMRWRNISAFKQYCHQETIKYLNIEDDYDSVAVCVWLRECIEKYIYNRLLGEDKLNLFEKRGTGKKIEFAEERNIDCPEIFSMLGLIYNDNLHIDNKSKIDSHETLYSRLENNTIREMIRKVVNDYSE